MYILFAILFNVNIYGQTRRKAIKYDKFNFKIVKNIIFIHTHTHISK